VASSEEQPVLTPVQLMWVNLFQDTLAALALATDPPAPSILDRKPDPKSAPLITIAMWKMIVGQTIYQMAVTLVLYFGGMRILSYHTAHERAQLQTMVFNIYVWMQIFNMYKYVYLQMLVKDCMLISDSPRQLGKNFNIFEGIFRNRFFIAISMIMIGGQILIAFVGGKAFSVTRLNKAQWAYSIVLGALSILIGAIIRVIPDKLFENMNLGLRRMTSRLTLSRRV
jgi:P-type Ca2+ transporter type 2C